MSDLKRLSIKLKSKQAMASINYRQKFVLVSARENVSRGTTTIQCYKSQ